MIKVVLIDDEYYFRNSLKRAIDWEGNSFSIIGDANNGRTAYELILQQQPDIAIVDINMPQITGLELIRMLKEKGSKCKFIILTGYDEFKYAQQAVSLGVSEYVLKPVDFSLLLNSLNILKEQIIGEKDALKKMNELVQMNKELSRNNFFMDLMNCNFALKDNELKEYCKDLGMDLNYKNYAVSLFECADITKPQIIKLQRSIYDTFHSGIRFESFVDTKLRLCLIHDTTDEEHFPDFINRICSQFASEGINAYAGIGGTYASLENLFLSYNEACYALKNKLVSEDRIIFYYKTRSSQNYYYFNIEIINKIKKNIKIHNTARLSDLINDIYNKFYMDKLSYDNIVIHTLELLSILTSTLSEDSTQPVSVFNQSNSIFDTLDSMQSIKDLQNWVLDIFSKSIKQLDSGKENFSDTTRKIENYINENYSNPELSIEKISKHLFTNYSYLCYCFKRDKNITIGDFITQVRINKALELLADHYENISNVAYLVGYDSPNYFSKCFKKITGVSPSEYIKIK